MKKTNKALVLAGLLLGSVSSVNAASIASTKHNLGSTGTGENKTAATTEICIFCHTPHGGGSTSAPLWNKTTATGGTYDLYDTTHSVTIDGEVSVGSVSIACLSCHDGAQAMDVVVNAPGSGLANVDGDTSVGGKNSLGLAAEWSGTRNTDGKLTGLANLAADDLTNDHPISIQYAGGGYSTANNAQGLNTEADATGVTTGDSDFNVPVKANINGAFVWYIDTDGTGGRSKQDLPLYTRDVSSTTQPFVECATCHDPHEADNATFLRYPNTGSQLCLACHNK